MSRFFSTYQSLFQQDLGKVLHMRDKRQILKHIKRHQLRSTMHTTPRPSHLEKTSENSRQNLIAEAEIKHITNISPTVKELDIHVRDDKFYFKAGQWLDMMIPGVDVVGGYSMWSPPHLLRDSGHLRLAIKVSKHPPAHWVHTKCKSGDVVNIRAGGDFFYNPSRGQGDHDLLLLAGGVGINPLISILQHFVHLNPAGSGSGGKEEVMARAAFLYSARSNKELIFKEKLKEINTTNQNVDVTMHCTREQPCENLGISGSGRFQSKDIMSAVSKLKAKQTQVYICGPEPFIKTMESFCLESGISSLSIFYESWW